MRRVASRRRPVVYAIQFNKYKRVSKWWWCCCCTQSTLNCQKHIIVTISKFKCGHFFSVWCELYIYIPSFSRLLETLINNNKCIFNIARFECAVPTVAMRLTIWYEPFIPIVWKIYKSRMARKDLLFTNIININLYLVLIWIDLLFAICKTAHEIYFFVLRFCQTHNAHSHAIQFYSMLVRTYFNGSFLSDGKENKFIICLTLFFVYVYNKKKFFYCRILFSFFLDYYMIPHRFIE